LKKAGIAELKKHLSRYLQRVKRGESILVFDRNQPVAQIIPVQNATRGRVSNEELLTRLERRGLIRRGSGDPKRWVIKRRPVNVRGNIVQDLLDERRSGW
jgi:prevent-host-death family protein